VELNLCLTALKSDLILRLDSIIDLQSWYLNKLKCGEPGFVGEGFQKWLPNFKGDVNIVQEEALQLTLGGAFGNRIKDSRVSIFLTLVNLEFAEVKDLERGSSR